MGAKCSRCGHKYEPKDGCFYCAAEDARKARIQQQRHENILRSARLMRKRADEEIARRRDRADRRRKEESDRRRAQERARERERAYQRQLAEQQRAAAEQRRIAAERLAAERRAAAERMRQEKKRQLRARLVLLKKTLEEKKQVFDEKREILIGIQKQIEDEEKEIAQFNFERNDDSIRIIVPLGHTGDGKSTLCNRIMGDTSEFGDEGPFATSSASESCTQMLSKNIAELEDVKISIVDTPGFGDSLGKDRHHANNLCAYLKGCGGINAFVLVRNSSNIRFDQGFQSMLSQYQVMFGNIFFERLIIIASKVDYNDRQFVRNRGARSMRDDIIRKFNLGVGVGDDTTYALNVIPFGVDNYLDGLKQLVESIPNEKFECDTIKSPIEQLREEEANAQAIADNAKQVMSASQNAVNQTEQQLYNM